MGDGRRAPEPGKATRPLHPMRLAVRLAAVTLLFCLGGCSILGSGSGGAAVTIYAPEVRVAADPAWPRANWSLAIAPPVVVGIIDGTRIAVRPTPGELQVYRGAAWAQPAASLLEGALLRTLEDSGRIAAVSRLGAGARADYRLLLDLRRFEADYAGQATPSATIEVNAKLLRMRDQRIVAARSFLQAQPAADAEMPQVANAFEQALGAISHDLAGWVLQSGHADGTARTRR